jgi:hypothetical protein
MIARFLRWLLDIREPEVDPWPESGWEWPVLHDAHGDALCPICGLHEDECLYGTCSCTYGIACEKH